MVLLSLVDCILYVFFNAICPLWLWWKHWSVCKVKAADQSVWTSLFSSEMKYGFFISIISVSALSNIHSWLTSHSLFSATTIPGSMLTYIQIIPMSSTQWGIFQFKMLEEESTGITSGISFSRCLKLKYAVGICSSSDQWKCYDTHIRGYFVLTHDIPVNVDEVILYLHSLQHCCVSWWLADSHFLIVNLITSTRGIHLIFITKPESEKNGCFAPWCECNENTADAQTGTKSAADVKEGKPS